MSDDLNDISITGTATNNESIKLVTRFTLPKIKETYYFADEGLRSDFDKFRSEVLEQVYPVGSIWWTSIDPSEDEGNPNNLFNGTWARITGNFVLIAANDSDKVTSVESVEGKIDQNTINCSYLDAEGNMTIKLTASQLPPHTHDISDPGHEHDIQTFGDDYCENTGGSGKNSSGPSGYPNFVHDGYSNMTSKNASYNIKATNKTTGIVVKSYGPNDDIDITPYHIKRYCWERVK